MTALTDFSEDARSVGHAWATAREAAGRSVPRVLQLGVTEEAEDHIRHGADVRYLRRIAMWLVLEQPTWTDLSMAMALPSAPKPDSVAHITRSGRNCPCCAVAAAV